MRQPTGTRLTNPTRASRDAAKRASGGTAATAPSKAFWKRDGLLFGLFLVAALLVGGRLFYLQVIKADAYSALASEQRTNVIAQHARRGTIYDRNGNILAISVEATTICAYLPQIEDPHATSVLLTQLLGGEYDDYYELLTADTNFVYIRRQADVADAERVQNYAAELAETARSDPDAQISESGSVVTALSGIDYQRDSRREYPYGQIGAQVIGAVDPDNRGISGLELLYDSILCGTDGSYTSERGRDGLPIPGGMIERVEPIDGQDIIISVDIELQQYAEVELARMGEERATDSGNIVVLDGTNGEIFAAASLPLYDRDELTQEALEAGATELKGISFAYEPGSIFKTATAAAAIEEGVMSPEDEIDVPVSLTFGEYTVSDSHEREAQTMSLRTIIVQSSNVGISLVEQRVGASTYAAYLERFGFGQPTHVDYPGESLGLLAPVDEWSEVQGATVSFGQGVSVTSLQMASFYGAIANDGVRYQPHFLIDRPQSQVHQSYDSERIMSVATADTLTDMLTSVTTDGTGHAARIEGYAIAGKTGTAEKAAEGGGYMIDNYIVSFVGFFAESESKLVCITSMDNPIGAEGNAPTGPLFASIMQFAATRYMIEPNG
jgi:cell division protein FtsI (penicillin-binding protein 3)